MKKLISFLSIFLNVSLCLYPISCSYNTQDDNLEQKIEDSSWKELYNKAKISHMEIDARQNVCDCISNNPNSTLKKQFKTKILDKLKLSDVQKSLLQKQECQICIFEKTQNIENITVKSWNCFSDQQPNLGINDKPYSWTEYVTRIKSICTSLKEFAEKYNLYFIIGPQSWIGSDSSKPWTNTKNYTMLKFTNLK